MKIAIIGVGRLGGALALALSGKGYQISELVSRSKENLARIASQINSEPKLLAPEQLDEISSEIVFITTPDPEIRNVAENLSRKLIHQPIVFHTSGALSSEILASLAAAGSAVASVHPLASVSDPESGAKRFKDAFFCIEGNPQACAVAEKIVSDLEGKSFSIETKFKTLYHASAVMASGHVTALISMAIEALAACGLNGQKSQEILFPLIKGTVENLSAQPPFAALTGTFARADAETLERHLQALRGNVSPEIFQVYLQLGFRSLELAALQGADGEKLSRMKDLLINNQKS